MAIDAYYGKPRNGKSYSVVENVLVPALNAGRNVYTNIPMNGAFSGMSNYHTFENNCGVMHFTTLPSGSVIVIDEAWQFFPAGDRVASIADEVKRFLAMHGHNVDSDGNTTQIVIISQTPSQLCSFIKGLVQNAYKITKKGERQFRTDHYSGDAAENLKGEYDSQFFTKFKTETFEAYKTATNSDTGFAGNEKRIDKRGGIGSSFLVKYGVPAALMLLIMGVYQGFKQFQSIGKKDPIQAETKQVDNKPQVVKVYAEDPEPAKTLTPLSTKYKVQGWSQYVKNGAISVHIRHTNGEVYHVDRSECDTFFDSYSCIVGGELVTPMSGTPDHVYNVQAMASPISNM